MYRFTLPVHKLFGHLVTFHTFYGQRKPQMNNEFKNPHP